LDLRLAGLLYGVEQMIVYIDGENAVHQLADAAKKLGLIKHRQGLLGIDIVGFLKDLLKADSLTVRYYTTTLRLVRTDPILEKRSREMMEWSEVWANKLAQQGIQIIKAGKLKVRDGEACLKCGHQESIFREKGVDVRLAVDLLVDSEEDKALIIWSSDADLVPAIQVAKRRGARVKNIAHKDFLNWAVAKQCGEWQTYTDKQLKELIKHAS